jgi:hypothetical protein
MIWSKTTYAINAYHHQRWEIPKGQSKMDNPEKLAAKIYENWIIDTFSLNVILCIKHNQDGSSMLNSV